VSGTTPLEPFTTFTGLAVPLDIANCDTDQLMPARFLRIATTDPQYPSFLLRDLRCHDDGSSKNFVFDQPRYRGARIIVGDINFGCGSSREVAVWGLTANNIRSVIAPGFGDIFYNNCIKNGVLPIRLAQAVCEQLRQQLHDSPGAQITIDLNAQSVTGPNGEQWTFDIDRFDQRQRHRWAASRQD